MNRNRAAGAEFDGGSENSGVTADTMEVTLYLCYELINDTGLGSDGGSGSKVKMKQMVCR